jgi:hypothetical protein
MTQKSDPDPYSLKLTGPGHSFSRQISEELANRVINLILTGVAATTPASGSTTESAASTAGNGGQLGSNVTPRQFMAQKKPGKAAAVVRFNLSEEQPWAARGAGAGLKESDAPQSLPRPADGPSPTCGRTACARFA